MVDDVLNEGGFDATPAQALRWLTRRHRRLVVRSRCYRKTASIGPTVALTRDYALPVDIRGIFEVDVAGVRYGDGRHSDISAQAQSRLWICGTGGVTTDEEDANGLGELALIPTPDTGGSTITVRGFFAPPDLLTADDTTLKSPSDYDDVLVAGAISTAYRRLLARPDLAGPFEQDFGNGCEELRVDTNRKYRGQGAVQMRVIGYNA
jgi:hypothetical protein